MGFPTIESDQRYQALVRAAPSVIVGLDFDGTLAPIVDDPTKARIHPDAGQVLIDLAAEIRAIAIITGRPARQALQLGELERVGHEIHALGKELYLFGQYGNEQWTAETRRIVTPRPPRGLATFERDLPRALRRADALDAYVEDKGLAVAVHTRRLPDPTAAFERLLPELRSLAHRHGLGIEPGKSVIEVRASDKHKGMVVEKLAADLDAGGFLMAGDDLGDIEAFEAVADLQKAGLATLCVCSASDEEGALVPLADLLVPGPEGVLALLRQLTVDARQARG